MGMTIDEVIKELEWALANNTIEDVESAFKYISAIHMAIDTMRKYQKIEQIIRIYDTPWEFHTLRGTVDKIREVIEDGTPNT